MSDPLPEQPAAAGGEPVPWKLRVEEPMNRFVHYPIARLVVPWLAKTPVTANQVTLVQPLLACGSGYLFALGGTMNVMLGVLVFGIRSLLDCVDGTLARAKGTCSPGGHALDALCDWLSAVALCVGIWVHFLTSAPPPGAWSNYLSVTGVLALAGLNGALRSFAGDRFLHKYSAIFDRGRDESVDSLRDKLLAIRTDRRPMVLFEAWIAWWGHLAFEFERFDVRRSRPLSDPEVAALQAARDEPLTRFIAGLWGVSNGDSWFTLVLASALVGQLWPMLLFLATFGHLWTIGVIALNTWFIRRTAARARLVSA